MPISSKDGGEYLDTAFIDRLVAARNLEGDEKRVMHAVAMTWLWLIVIHLNGSYAAEPPRGEPSAVERKAFGECYESVLHFSCLPGGGLPVRERDDFVIKSQLHQMSQFCN